jgi:pyrroline-5-carboxylate reductase
MKTKQRETIAILGAGNIGASIASGLFQSGIFKPANIILTRRRTNLLEPFQQKGLTVLSDNVQAVSRADIIVVAVEPLQIDRVLEEIKPAIEPERHILISVVSGVTVREMESKLGKKVPVVRAMPNTAIAQLESMTCLAADEEYSEAVDVARRIFDTVGKTLLIEEEQMMAATALGACGIAFFLRAVRAASQGGIEIGFHSADALFIAAQTAKGAASLLLSSSHHPEYEIDKVTTPRGCTIAGLNQMEHEGFSSAMIKGIITSATIASQLYSKEGEKH